MALALSFLAQVKIYELDPSLLWQTRYSGSNAIPLLEDSLVLFLCLTQE